MFVIFMFVFIFQIDMISIYRCTTSYQYLVGKTLPKNGGLVGGPFQSCRFSKKFFQSNLSIAVGKPKLWSQEEEWTILVSDFWSFTLQ